MPDSLYYSARVDGARQLDATSGASWCPLSRPALVTIGLLERHRLLELLPVDRHSPRTRSEVRTLPFGLYAFMTSSGIRYERLMAASTIVVVPMILLFIFCRKSIVTGVSRGGLKG